MDFLKHPHLEKIIRWGLAEDLGDEGDHTTLATIPESQKARAQCLIKEEGVIAGIAFAEYLFQHIDSTLVFRVFKKDGEEVKRGDVAFELEGKARSILVGERLCLNVMQRMSGIATKTRKMVRYIRDLPCKLLDTRKTTPGVRLLEKWAVHIGGGQNHRFGLYDLILIKDNHVDAAGGIANALHAAKIYLQSNNLNLKIEVETRTLQEVQEALSTQIPDIIMLDNMDVFMMRQAVQMIEKRCLIEASGNITEENLREKALTGVDFISCGALTHSFKSMDISLKIRL